MKFAPLIRVSTESQEKRGESLRTQKEQVIQAVELLKGTIPASCWKYSGQESATTADERRMLDQLLADSSKGIFDAVIVVDESRWSRNNKKSEIGLDTLLENGIRFFVLTNEFDLSNEDDRFMLNIKVSVHALSARKNARKSMMNRIARAKRGIPTSGSLPYGRTFNKETETWGLDPVKVDRLKQAAKDYLNDVKFSDICTKHGFQKDHLHKIFRESSDDKFPIRFRSKKLNINETVTLTIPPLLDKMMVERIRAKARANLTYHHGEPKNRYLLSRMIFCGHCGSGLSGITINRTNKTKPNKSYSYYMHDPKPDCDFPRHVNADEIEQAVIVKLFGMFGDIAGMEKAMKKAIPNMQEIEDLRKRQTILRKNLGKAQKEKNRVIDFIAEGVLDKTEAKAKIEGIRNRENLLTQEIDQITQKTEDIPTEPQIKRKSKLLRRMIRSIYTSPDAINEMTFSDKRKLLESVFMGKDYDGKKLGVYVRKEKDGIHYSINGGFGDLAGKLPMTESEVIGILGIPETERIDVSNYQDLFSLNDTTIPFKLQGLVNKITRKAA